MVPCLEMEIEYQYMESFKHPTNTILPTQGLGVGAHCAVTLFEDPGLQMELKDIGGKDYLFQMGGWIKLLLPEVL